MAAARCVMLAAAALPAVSAVASRGQDLRAAMQGVSTSFAWSGLGCYQDEKTDRVFQFKTTSSDNSESTCQETCADYPYFGLQYGSECWCGDYTTTYDKHGTSSRCTMECSGDPDSTCGGYDALYVYTQAETDMSAIGCYADDKYNRVFEEKYTDETNASPDFCIDYCKNLGYYYAATQYSKECWCGTEDAVPDVNGDAECDMPCAGDPTKFCGGFDALTVYLVDSDVTPAPISTSVDPTYLGCYSDMAGGERVFAVNTVLTTNDPTTCAAYCSSLEASYFGLQYGVECWCGGASTDVTQYGEGMCDMTCPGDSSVTCGGFYSFDAYALDEDVITATPSPTKVGATPEPTPEATPEPSPESPVCTSCPEIVFEQTMPVPSPTPIMTTPEYDPDCAKASVRWANSTGVAGRAYFEGGGCATLTDLYNERSDKYGAKGPIYILDENDDVIEGPAEPTGKWLLMGELYVEDGSILYVHGTSIGGDCDELRIQSEGDVFHEIRGHGGSLSFKSTLVTSWDRTLKAPTDDYENGRSFINCVSEHAPDVECVGQAKNEMGECRMDIIDSEMGHLGYFASESYGLTWKVRGFCVDKSNPEVFDNTNVYGDIINSDIHHMYYGMYSYGHQGGVWTDNVMRDNYQYGFDPHDDSDYLTIARNTVYNNVNHGIIASKRCNNVEIYDNEVYNGGAQAAGIFLHRSTDSAKVYNNYVHDMQDAGLANLESFDSEVYDNVFENVKYGIRISLGGSNNYVHDNEFINCEQYGLYTYMGSDEPDVSDNGRPTANIFYNNMISDTSVGVKLKEADDTIVIDNEFTGTTELQFADTYGTIWCGNEIPDDVCKDTKSGDTVSDFDSEYACDLPEEC